MVKQITTLLAIGCKNSCFFYFLFFGVNDFGKVDVFKQIKIKKGNKKAEVSNKL